MGIAGLLRQSVMMGLGLTGVRIFVLRMMNPLRVITITNTANGARVTITNTVKWERVTADGVKVTTNTANGTSANMANGVKVTTNTAEGVNITTNTANGLKVMMLRNLPSTARWTRIANRPFPSPPSSPE